MRTNRTLLLAIVLLLMPSWSLAQNKDQLLQKAKSAEQAGDIEGAALAYCDLAKVETATYGPKCQAYSNLVNKEIENDGRRMRTGKDAFANKDWESAKQAFHAVKTSGFKKEAEDYLTNKIPQAEQAAAKEAQQQQQQQAAAAASATASKQAQNLQAARDAMKAGDFATARSMANQAGAEGQALLPQIAQAEKAAQSQSAYNSAVQSGDSLLAQGKFTEAVNQYRQAAALKGSTPEDLRRKIDDAENRARAAQSGSVSGQIMDASRQPLSGARIILQSSSGFRQTASSDGGGSFHFAGVPPGNYMIAASKDGRTVANTRVAVGPGQNAGASLVASAAPAGAEGGASDLERAVGLFYKGSPDDLLNAELLLENGDYKGKRKALSDFFVGASKLSLFYLAGANKNDQEQKALYAEALKSFAAARHTAGFKPPLEMSPKILRAYQQAR
ncbi:MAG: carboxypeptidase regulatory-like domain-containing protein [Terriglobales bacterium]